MQHAGAKPGRFALVDMVRGTALVAMVWYHLNWDLRYFNFTLTPIDTDFWWHVLQKTIVGGFMLVTGASLVLAHGQKIRWNRFWRREAQVVAGALAISAVTFIVFPDAFVYFGVLHAIATFALLGLLFVRTSAWVKLAGGLLFFLPALFFADPAFNARPLSWIGFWVVPPLTEDLVPVFPWFGVTLFGQALMTLMLSKAWGRRLLAADPFGFVGRAVAATGRRSLLIYLVHQPILFALLMPLAAFLGTENWHREANFAASCQQSCVVGQGEVGFCQAYCACALEQVQKDDLWAAFAADPLLPEQAKQVSEVSRLCTAMAREGPAAPAD